MGFTRKGLAALGLEAAVIDQVMENHVEVVDGLKDQIKVLEGENVKLKESVEGSKAIQKELDDLKKQVEDDKKANAGKDYDKLKEEFENYKADIQKKEVRASKEAAYREILKDAGIPEKHFAKILKYSDVDGIELDDKGKATTAKDILKAVKEEWEDHIEKTATKGAETENPPKNTGGSGMTKEQIMQIKDAGERQQAIADNPGLFGL